jgi:hypothetical protein
MTSMPIILEVVTLEQLDTVTGGGLGSQIGGLFGEKGAKWGGIADSLFGMIKGGGGGKGGGLDLGSLFGGGGSKKTGGDTGGADTSGAAPSGDAGEGG